MTLNHWIATTSPDLDAFARQIGVTPEAVRRYRNGSRMPEPLIAERIVKATRGKVTIQDLHDTRLRFLRMEAA